MGLIGSSRLGKHYSLPIIAFKREEYAQYCQPLATHQVPPVPQEVDEPLTSAVPTLVVQQNRSDRECVTSVLQCPSILHLLNEGIGGLGETAVDHVECVAP